MIDFSPNTTDFLRLANGCISLVKELQDLPPRTFSDDLTTQKQDVLIDDIRKLMEEWETVDMLFITHEEYLDFTLRARIRSVRDRFAPKMLLAEVELEQAETPDAQRDFIKKYADDNVLFAALQYRVSVQALAYEQLERYEAVFGQGFYEPPVNFDQS